MNEIVILDFDGVIAQTFQLALAINKITNPDLTASAFREELETNQRNIVANAIDTKEEAARFWDMYSSKIIQQPLVPGIANVIARLDGAFALVIVSTTDSRPIKQYLANHNLLDHFDMVLGSDTHSSKAAKIQMVLGKFKARPSEAVMITDTLGDIRDAKSVQVLSIAVTWGFHLKQTLQKGQPSTIVDEPHLLSGSVEEFFDFSDEYD